MIRCPKCGFEQPPDRYCARCGVNMETFKAPRIPITRRLAGSGGFNIFLITTVIVATAYFVYNRRHTKYEGEDTGTVAATTTPNQASKPETTANSNPAPAAPALPTASALPRAAKSLKQAASALFNKDDSSTAQDSVAAADARTKAKPKLTVHFVEVPQTAIPVLFAGVGDGTGNGVIPEFTSHFEDVRKSVTGEVRVVSLSRAEKNLTANSAIDLNQELTEGRGIFVHVIPTAISETNAILEIQIENRGQTAGAKDAPVSIQDFEGNFALPNHAAAYFEGVLARSPIKPEDEDLISRNPIYRVLTSQAFLQNTSNFFIFFEITGLSEAGSQ